MAEMKVFNEKMQKFKVCMDGLNAEINTDTEKLKKLMEEKTMDDVSKKEMMKAAMTFASKCHCCFHHFFFTNIIHGFFFH